MGVVINNIAAVFIIMGVGFIANRIGLLPEAANKYLSPLLIQITTPCLVLSTIASKEVEEGTWGSVIEALVLACLYFAVFCFIAWVICVRIFRMKKDPDCGVYMMLFASINNGFIGLPITYAIFGEEKLFFMVFFQMALMLYIYGPGVVQLHYGDNLNGMGKNVLKSALGPGTIAALLGLVVLCTGIRLPEMIFKSIESIGAATTPLSMIVIGIQLGSSNFRKIIGNGRLIALSFIKMLITPVITFLLVNWLPIPPALKLVLVFGAAFPSAVATTPLSDMEGKNAQLAAEGVAFTTLLSLATIPVTAYLVSLIYL